MDAAALITLARSKAATIATAESCTGGMVAVALTDIPGSSDVFDRGFVTYSNAAKVDMLGVNPATLQTHGAVSEPVAAEMANGALARSTATLAVSVTGIAGPGGSEHKPEGRVCFGVAQSHQPTRTETIDFGPLGRARVRAAARDHAMHLLASALGATDTSSSLEASEIILQCKGVCGQDM
jgi:nicotinamide-nucleotide amidase